MIELLFPIERKSPPDNILSNSVIYDTVRLRYFVDDNTKGKSILAVALFDDIYYISIVFGKS